MQEEVSELTEEGRPAKQARIEGSSVSTDGPSAVAEQPSAAQQPAGPEASGSAGAAASAAAEAQALADVEPALSQPR